MKEPPARAEALPLGAEASPHARLRERMEAPQEQETAMRPGLETGELRLV
jgi:hypothetical protein